MQSDDQREPRGRPAARRPARSLRRRAVLVLAMVLAGAGAGCAGNPQLPPPGPLPDDSYSGGSNFGGPPMNFGVQTGQ